MQVILLAAGQSTRLDPIQDKNLLEFCGKTLIEHKVADLKRAKLRDVVVVGNKNNIESLKNALKKYQNILFAEQKKLEDGMAGGVLAGGELVRHKNIMVLSTNDVFDYELLEKTVNEYKKNEDGLIVGKKTDKYFPGGYLKMDKQGFLTDIIEKPAEGKEPSNMVNMVLHIFNDFPTFFKRLKNTKGKADGRYEQAMDGYIKKDKAKIKVLKYHGFWQPIKYPWHILKVMEYFLDKQESRVDKTAKISKSAKIDGNVFIGPNVKILDNAVIKGSAYIADGCVVANNSLVRGSMLGKNCVVGFSSEVARSYINHDVWMHTNYIGDSIVDNNVSFGAGTVLGNLRFDEENIGVRIKGIKTDSQMNKLGAVIGNGTRFGVNSCTNPGIKIGKNVFVGANVLVDEDICDDRMVILEQKWKTIVNTKSANVKKRK